MDFGSFFGLILDIGQLIFALAGVAVVLFLCYWFSKYMAKKMNHMSKGNNMKIVERIALTQDKGLVIMELCGHYYLGRFRRKYDRDFKRTGRIGFTSSTNRTSL